jgi:hypothetical protein
MNIHPFTWLLIVVFLGYMITCLGTVLWWAITARPYKFTRRPPAPPDGTPGSS